jgi:hypothetical protein
MGLAANTDEAEANVSNRTGSNEEKSCFIIPQ